MSSEEQFNGYITAPVFADGKKHNIWVMGSLESPKLDSNMLDMLACILQNRKNLLLFIRDFQTGYLYEHLSQDTTSSMSPKW